MRLQIPKIGVEAGTVNLGLTRGGALEAPKTFSKVGWWSGGASPGERGPAVFTGHVDSRATGPAVFYRLGELDAGDEVAVTRRDGVRLEFVVEGKERYPKDDFPTLKVYGKTSRPELRLITCSGEFDTSTGHYVDNLVVFARLERRHRARS